MRKLVTCKSRRLTRLPLCENGFSTIHSRNRWNLCSSVLASSSRNNFGLSSKTRCIDLVLITACIALTMHNLGCDALLIGAEHGLCCRSMAQIKHMFQGISVEATHQLWCVLSNTFLLFTSYCSIHHAGSPSKLPLVRRSMDCIETTNPFKNFLHLTDWTS